MKTIMPNIVLIGATGAGKNTVAGMLYELADYRHVGRHGDHSGRVVVTDADLPEYVDVLRERSFTIVEVLSARGDRFVRLSGAGRLPSGMPLPDDNPSCELADHTIPNFEGKDTLREYVAGFLSRVQA